MIEATIEEGMSWSMDRKYCIFDMDGTLVESMGYWRHLGIEYLEGKGISEAEAARTMEAARNLTLYQSVQLVLDTYDLPGTPEDVLVEMRDIMERHYRTDVELKPGVVDYLDRLREQGCRLCVATATDERLAHICLERLGIDDRFEFLLSCQTIGIGKEHPHIYLQATVRLNCQPEETAVFEDALYAAQSAKAAGFYTVGVWDRTQTPDWPAMTALADEIVMDWRSLLPFGLTQDINNLPSTD